MSEEQKNNQPNALEKGAATAHTVQGALKTGNAIANISKGAAIGGPYGMAAGAVWGARKHIGKIILAMATLFLLPVIVIMMLPGLIFGGFTNAFSSADPGTPILNSKTAIVENSNEITFTIISILSEGMADTEKRIAKEFKKSDCDYLEIINPYENNPLFNATLFISQYCAYKSNDFKGISLADMKQLLLDHIDSLYSYRWIEEYRERPMTEEELERAEEQTTITEKWRVYTLVYNGETYFADHIFALSDSQKILADNYAYNLSLFLGDGMLQNLTAWNGNAIGSLGNVTFTDGITEVVYYNQLDERFANEPYGTDMIGGYGCGPTSMAIVVSSLSGETVDPVEMAAWSYENGYWCKNSGSYHALIPAAAQNWGLSASGCTASEPQRILDALAEGKLVVAIMGKGHFTSSGHFIVLRGVKDGQILVADPASYTRSEQTWDLSIILNEASKNAGSGGPFWIIG